MIELLRALAGVLAGTLAGTFGSGGGVVLTPLLTVLGFDQHHAQAMTLAATLLPVGLPAVLVYRRMVTIDLRLAAAIALGFITGVGPGAFIATHVPVRELSLLFGLGLIGVGIRTVVASLRPPLPGPAGPPRSRLHGLWIGLISGTISGLLGLGGGIITIPLVRAVLGRSHEEAQAASMTAMLPPIGLPGVLVYVSASTGFPWSTLVLLTVCVALGSWLGGRLALKLRGPMLRAGFGVLQLFVAAVVILRAW